MADEETIKDEKKPAKIKAEKKPAKKSAPDKGALRGAMVAALADAEAAAKTYFDATGAADAGRILKQIKSAQLSA